MTMRARTRRKQAGSDRNGPPHARTFAGPAAERNYNLKASLDALTMPHGYAHQLKQLKTVPYLSSLRMFAITSAYDVASTTSAISAV